MKKIRYYYRGPVEVGNGKPGYTWVNGYSETAPDGGVMYPLMSKRDCRHDAKCKGATAIFMDLTHSQLAADREVGETEPRTEV